MDVSLVASATQHHSSSLLLMSLPVRKKRKLSLEFCWFAGGDRQGLICILGVNNRMKKAWHVVHQPVTGNDSLTQYLSR
eukprot:scaffold23445_cov179-Skeletonema_marinoi.AAC.1